MFLANLKQLSVKVYIYQRMHGGVVYMGIMYLEHTLVSMLTPNECEG
jgi:hypothetical protein